MPCVMRWPTRIKAGQTCQQVASTIDGRDVGALLDDPNAKTPHDEIGFYYYKNNRLEAIRLGKWKLHLKKTPELYDLRADISESKNVATAQPEVVARLLRVASKYDADLRANTRPAWNAAGKRRPKKK